MLRALFAGLLGCLLAVNAQAMAIDKMLLVIKDRSGFFEVRNNTPHPLFVSTSVTEKDISAEAIIDTQYTADNIEKWKVNVSPAKFVLPVGETKIVYVNENTCANQKACARPKDAVMSVTFMPHIYVPEGEEGVSDVGILFGFEPVVVLPAQEQNVSYTYKLEQGTGEEQGKQFLVVNNTGNTMVSVIANQCRQLPVGAKQNNCVVFRHVYNGRTARIELPLPYKKNSLDIKVVNSFETYKKDYVL